MTKPSTTTHFEDREEYPTVIEFVEDEFSWPDNCDDNRYNEEDKNEKTVAELAQECLESF